MLPLLPSLNYFEQLTHLYSLLSLEKVLCGLTNSSRSGFSWVVTNKDMTWPFWLKQTTHTTLYAFLRTDLKQQQLPSAWKTPLPVIHYRPCSPLAVAFICWRRVAGRMCLSVPPDAALPFLALRRIPATVTGFSFMRGHSPSPIYLLTPRRAHHLLTFHVMLRRREP